MYEKIMVSHFEDLTRLSSLLSSYVNSYRLLVAGASELNTIYGRKSKEVEKAIARADNVGTDIDEILKMMDKYQDSYLKYIKLKNDIVIANYKSGKIKEEVKGTIQTEIDNELKFFNQTPPKREEGDEKNNLD